MALRIYCFLVLILLFQTATHAAPIDLESTKRSRDDVDAILSDISTEDDDDDSNSIRLSQIYHDKVLPAMKDFNYLSFSESALTEKEIQTTPLVLFVGSRNTGKTQAIQHLLGLTNRLPENTDKFTVYRYGKGKETLSGEALMEREPDFEWNQLPADVPSELLAGVSVPNPLLQSVMLVDTPSFGLPNLSEFYDETLAWFAHRSASILLFFEPNNLEITVQLKQLLGLVKGRAELVLGIVLNKADNYPQQNLMRAYRDLIWYVCPLMNITEPPRMYVVSLDAQPHQKHTMLEHLNADELKLAKHLAKTATAARHRDRVAMVRHLAKKVRQHAILSDAFAGAFRANRGVFRKANLRMAREIIRAPKQFGVITRARAQTKLLTPPDIERYAVFFEKHPLSDQLRIEELCRRATIKDEQCSVDLLDQAIEVDLKNMLKETKEAMKADERKPREARTKPEPTSISEAEPHPEDTPARQPPTQDIQPDEQIPEIKEIKKEKIKKTAKRSKPKIKQKEEHSKQDEIDSTETSEPPEVRKSKKSSAGKRRPATPVETETDEPLTEQQEEKTEPDDGDAESAVIQDKQDTEDQGHEDDTSPPANLVPAGFENRPIDHNVPDLNATTIVVQLDAVADVRLACRYRKSCYDTGVLRIDRVNVTESKALEMDKKFVDPKLRCKFRKSCYETGELPPDIGAVYRPPTAEDDEETLDRRPLKERCRYRKSCYETDNTAEWMSTYNARKKDGNTIAAEQPPLETISMDLDDTYWFPLKLRCKYRKSCYDTGVLPDLKHVVPIYEAPKREQAKLTLLQKKNLCKYRKGCYEHVDERLLDGNYEFHTETVKVPKEENLVPTRDEEPIDIDSMSFYKKKLACKYKKSCYETGIIPPREVLQVHRLPSAKDETIDVELLSELQKKVICKYRRSCYESGQIPLLNRPKPESSEQMQQINEPPAQEKRQKPAPHKHSERHKEKHTDSRKKDDVPKSKTTHGSAGSGTKKMHHKHPHRHTARVPAKAEILTVDLTRAAGDVRVRCKYRKSCYETGVVPNITAVKPAATTIDPSTNTLDFASMNALQQKVFCGYRTSCYHTGTRPVHLQNIPQDTRENEVITEEQLEELTVTQMKVKCKYRKPCYETGEIPLITARNALTSEQQADSVPVTFETMNVLQKKVHCKYRHSCYDTGEKPIIITGTQTAVTSSTAEEVDFAMLNPLQKRLFCRYRLSCYDTGVVPSLAVVPHEHQEIEEIVDISLLTYTQKKVRCKYRISCLDALEEHDTSDESDDEPTGSADPSKAEPRRNESPVASVDATPVYREQNDDGDENGNGDAPKTKKLCRKQKDQVA